MSNEEFYPDIIAAIIKLEKAIAPSKLNKDQISGLKTQFCKKHGLSQIPTDFEIALNANTIDRRKLKSVQSKPMRTGSGVAVVAVMTSPSDCPHGRCVYCPGGMKSHFGDMPQSYTGKEPATLRGIRNNYDPYLQVFNRLEQYTVLGHSYDKIELIIMGGTFIARPKEYREEFIGYSLKAMNDFSDKFYSKKTGEFQFSAFKKFFELPGDIGNSERTKRVHGRILALKSGLELEKEQERNETSKIRCVAMCLETRPDYCKEEHINEMLRLGTTRVELGVQTLDNDILKAVERGHTVEDSIIATRLMKDSLLKVGYHMMPGLPGSTSDSDLDMLKRLFSDPNFKPDALKIYPCMVMPGTKLFSEYKNGKFMPISTDEAARLIAHFKRDVPEYCRIMRVQRDIPTFVTSAGVDKTNLRQYVNQIMKAEGIKCRCIRCREPGLENLDMSNLNLKKQIYQASGGIEIFISAEDAKKDVLAGFIRLRIPLHPFREEFGVRTEGLNKTAGIRELHVYGEMAGIGETKKIGKGKVQHKGIGKMLMAEAEKLAKEEYGRTKMLVISGIGAREYYKKLGYEREGVYMAKRL